MKLGLYTGDPSLSRSYLYGLHWKNLKGYKVVLGNDDCNHRFGGNDWNLPVCSSCNESYHQIFTFDLRDKRLKEFGMEQGELPLTACLNCSSLWERQLYGIDFEKKKVVLLEVNDKEQWVQEEDLKIPVPLPMHHVKLVELNESENPIDKKSYYDLRQAAGKDYLCRLSGAPLFAESPIDIECPRCKQDMIYIASVFGEEFESDNLFPDVAFEFGEMAIYYHYCPHCQIMKVESQGA